MRRDDRAALAEHLAHLGVDDQVDVALAVAHLDVRQAVPLLGQRAGRLGQHDDVLGHDGQLADAGLRQRDRRAAHDADEVAALHLLEQLVGGVADQVLPDPDLNLAGPVEQLDERHLAERAEGDDAAGDLEVLVRDQRRRRLLVVGGGGGAAPANFAAISAAVCVGAETVRVGIAAEGANFLGFFLAFGDQLAFVRHGSPRVANRTGRLKPLI